MLIQSKSDYWKLPYTRIIRLEKIASQLGRKDIWHQGYCPNPENDPCPDLTKAEMDNIEADSTFITNI